MFGSAAPAASRPSEPTEEGNVVIGTLILSHGQLADELLSAARTISGDLSGFKALSLDWSDGFEQAQDKIRQTLEELDEGDGVLILTDMFGGTPCNVALTFMEPGKVEIVTGVNLPMVVRLGCLVEKGKPLPEVACWLQEKGKRSISVASEVLESRPAPAVTGDPCDEEAPALATAGVAVGASEPAAKSSPEGRE